MRVVAGAIAGLVGIFLLSIFFGSWYTIDQGERGVILRNGAVVGTAEPGLGFKIPFIDRVVDISVQSRAKVYEAVETYSRDQQLATLSISVNYRLPPDQVEEIYAQYGGEDSLVARLIDRRVYELVKTVFGRFNASTAIQERQRLNTEIADAIQSAVAGPVIIDGVQIEDISFSSVYEQSIEARMLAEVEVQKREQELAQQKVQAEITVTQAQAQADARLAEAKAQAEAVRLAGEAEADAIRAKGAALRDNPLLVGLIQAERWDGRLPTTMPPGGTVPFLNLLPAQ